MPLVLTATANPGAAAWQDASALGGSIGIYTIRPAGPADPDNNIYTSWADMYAVASVSSAPIKRVILDSPSVAVVVPAGTYDLAGYYIQGDTTLVPSASVLSCGDGVVFENFTGNLYNMWLVFTAGGVSDPLVSFSDGATHVIQSGPLTAYINAGPTPMFSATGNSIISFFAQDFTVLQAGGPDELFDIALGSTLQLSLLTGVTVGDEIMRGDGDANVIIYGGSVSYNPAQTHLTGTLIVSIGDWLYTPSAGFHWDDPDPANVAEALDRLASAVSGLLGTPIP